MESQRLADTVEEGDRITQDGLWIGVVTNTDAEQRTLSGVEEAIELHKEGEPEDTHTFTHAQINLYWESLA